jgi:dipeptide transport system ATP-binding protein
MNGDTVLEARDLARYYPVHRGAFARPVELKALDGASFTLERRKTLAVVGESGCGKSTLARLVTMIEPPTRGELKIAGVDVASADAKTLRRLRSKVQIVFQNPYGSLNPRQKIGSALEEPLLVNTKLSASERRERARAMMAAVGLRQEHYERYPHMFSGGQRQRVAIARALMLDPEILVLDEPVSALDVSIQAQVLNLLHDMQERMNLAYMFISHDLSVVRHIADDVMVMYLGRPVEHGPRDAIFANPQHPYTRALLEAVPQPKVGEHRPRVALRGEVPSPMNPPSGCRFRTRCPLAQDICAEVAPPLVTGEDGHAVACHFAGQVAPPPVAA